MQGKKPGSGAMTILGGRSGRRIGGHAGSGVKIGQKGPCDSEKKRIEKKKGVVIAVS